MNILKDKEKTHYEACGAPLTIRGLNIFYGY
jgi:hypothetical protein